MYSASRFASIASGLLLLGVARQRTQAQSSTGWTYAVKTEIDSGWGADRRVSIAARNQVTDTKARIQFSFLSGSRETMASMGSVGGMYMILDDRDSSMTNVMPGAKMATKMNLTSMLGGRQLNMSVGPQHLTKNELEDVGPGETILGHSTHRYRVTQMGTGELTILGQRCVLTVNTVTDLWIAPGVDIETPSQAMASHYLGTFGMKDIKSDLGESQSKLPKGATLRTIGRSITPDGKGGTTTVTSTMEFTELSHGSIPDSVFAVPRGYRVMDMAKMMADVPAGMLDSGMNAAMAKSAGTICGAAKP